jgi:hypothetical protein
VLQDYFAKVFACTLAAVLAPPAARIVEEQTEPRVHRYQVNFKSVLCGFRRQIARLLLRLNPAAALRRFLFLAVSEPVAVRRGPSSEALAKEEPKLSTQAEGQAAALRSSLQGDHLITLS